MAYQNKWEEKLLLKIRREFTKDEKYKILMDDYHKMVKQIEIYKKEITTLKEKQYQLKKQLTELQSKYTKIIKI